MKSFAVLALIAAFAMSGCSSVSASGGPGAAMSMGGAVKALTSDAKTLITDASKTSPGGKAQVITDCKHLSGDVDAAQKLDPPSDQNAAVDWGQAVAVLLGVSEDCNTLVQGVPGLQMDSVLNQAHAGLVGLSLTAKILGIPA